MTALNKPIQLKRIKKNEIPTKKVINIATCGQSKSKAGLIAIICLAAVVVIAVVGKFGVLDRLEKISEIRNNNVVVQQEIDKYNEKISQFADIEEDNHHYTYEGWTSDELNLIAKTTVLDFMDRYIKDPAKSFNWAVNGNILSMTMSDISLAEANVIASEMENDPLVNYCTLSTASTNDGFGEIANTKITVYLNGPLDIEAAEAKASVKKQDSGVDISGIETAENTETTKEKK